MLSHSVAIACGVFGLVFCGGYLVMLLLDRYSAGVNARLSELPKGVFPQSGGALVAAPETKPDKRTAKWPDMVDRLVPDGSEDRKRQQSRLLQAGIYSPVALSTFFAAKLALMVLPPLVGLFVGYWGLANPKYAILWGCIAGGAGMIVPSLWLEAKVRRRHQMLRHSVPDFLDLMIVCLESGLSLQGAVQRVTDELRIAHPALAGELGIVQSDISLGAAIDVALRRFADRSGYEGIRTLSTFVRESQRFGTQLTEALRIHADMLRDQREQDAEETAQKASVKLLIPMLLLILPAVFIVLAGPAAIQIQKAFSK